MPKHTERNIQMPPARPPLLREIPMMLKGERGVLVSDNPLHFQRMSYIHQSVFPGAAENDGIAKD